MEYDILVMTIRAVLCIEYIYIVLMFIGWLLATDYYDTIRYWFDEFCFIMFNVVITVVMIMDIAVQCIALYKNDFYDSSQMVPIVLGGFVNASIVLIGITTGVVLALFKIREYSEYKRGK